MKEDVFITITLHEVDYGFDEGFYKYEFDKSNKYMELSFREPHRTVKLALPRIITGQLDKMHELDPGTAISIYPGIIYKWVVRDKKSSGVLIQIEGAGEYFIPKDKLDKVCYDYMSSLMAESDPERHAKRLPPKFHY